MDSELTKRLIAQISQLQERVRVLEGEGFSPEPEPEEEFDDDYKSKPRRRSFNPVKDKNQRPHWVSVRF